MLTFYEKKIVFVNDRIIIDNGARIQTLGRGKHSVQIFIGDKEKQFKRFTNYKEARAWAYKTLRNERAKILGEKSKEHTNAKRRTKKSNG